jgi:hypothetical protein
MVVCFEQLSPQRSCVEVLVWYAPASQSIVFGSVAATAHLEREQLRSGILNVGAYGGGKKGLW